MLRHYYCFHDHCSLCTSSLWIFWKYKTVDLALSSTFRLLSCSNFRVLCMICLIIHNTIYEIEKIVMIENIVSCHLILVIYNLIALGHNVRWWLSNLLKCVYFKFCVVNLLYSKHKLLYKLHALFFFKFDGDESLENVPVNKMLEMIQVYTCITCNR